MICFCFIPTFIPLAIDLLHFYLWFVLSINTFLLLALATPMLSSGAGTPLPLELHWRSLYLFVSNFYFEFWVFALDSITYSILLGDIIIHFIFKLSIIYGSSSTSSRDSSCTNIAYRSAFPVLQAVLQTFVLSLWGLA